MAPWTNGQGSGQALGKQRFWSHEGNGVCERKPVQGEVEIPPEVEARAPSSQQDPGASVLEDSQKNWEKLLDHFLFLETL